MIRTRLVAFGQASYTDVHTLNLAHILTQMSTFMGIYEDVLKPAQFSETVPAFLRLLAKTQIELKPTT